MLAILRGLGMFVVDLFKSRSCAIVAIPILARLHHQYVRILFSERTSSMRASAKILHHAHQFPIAAQTVLFGGHVRVGLEDNLYLEKGQEPKSPFVFTSERGAPFSTAGFARMVERAGREAKLAFKAHPHMLRHACGYALANKGHDTRALQAYLGHRNIQHTVRYTELSQARFKDFWRD